MARPREFDEERAVDAAMHAFWAAGYEATSTQALCDATGLGRSSIYNTFKCKHDLFERALERYADTATRHQVEVLESEGPALEKIRRLLDDVVEDEFGGARRGCLAVNTTLELGGRDLSATAVVRRGFDRLVEALRAAIERAQRAGEIAPERDADALAQFVHATISGMRVLAASGATREAVRGVAAVTLAALKPG